ncbi:MAG: hypothetical protein WBP12_04440 [Candidatus Saccharimonas sp.]
MAAAPSITVRTPDGVLTFTPDSTSPLARLYAQTVVEAQIIQEAIDTYLQALIASLATEIDFTLERAAFMFWHGREPSMLTHQLSMLLAYRNGGHPRINDASLMNDLTALIGELQALSPVSKPVPVPPPGAFVSSIGHELEEE